MLPEKQLIAAIGKVDGVPIHGPFSRAVGLQYLYPKPPPAPRVKALPLWGMGSKLYGGRYTPKNSFETVYVARDPVTALAEVTAIKTIRRNLFSVQQESPAWDMRSDLS